MNMEKTMISKKTEIIHEERPDTAETENPAELNNSRESVPREEEVTFPGKMSPEDLSKEIERLDRKIDAFNFVKSIVRVFSIHFMNAIDQIGGWQIEELCGTGSNGIVFTVRKKGCSRLNPTMALKIPNLSHFMLEWFDLSEAHMFDPPHEKFAEITEEILRTTVTIERETKEIQSCFQNIEEEKSFKREFFSLQAIGVTEKGVRYLEDYGTFDLILKQDREVFCSRCFSYNVTPLFRGETLTAYFTRNMENTKRWKKAIELLGDIIDIVDHIHRQDLIHRDLHPKNFLYNEENGELNLIDFGSSFVHRDATLDIPGQRRGSKRYMSPEQYCDPREVDIRSDFFFIGGLFQFMLTKRTPFLRTRTVETLPLLPKESLKDFVEMLQGTSAGEMKDNIHGIPLRAVEASVNLINALLSYRREERPGSIAEIREAWKAIDLEMNK